MVIKEGRPIARQLKPGDRLLRGKNVRVISATGEQLGIMTYEEALARASSTEMDLVDVASQADPPVCRIMDFGKQQYQQSKRQRDARKKQHHHKVKEIKFHPNIDLNDYRTKLNHALVFLSKGDSVKVSMFFRGREMAHTDLGMEVMKRFLGDVCDVASVDSPPRHSGRMIAMMLSPKVKK